MKNREREHFTHFSLAGFSYYDGVFAVDQLEIGQQLELVPEPDNQYDKQAVMVCLSDYKLGYIPRTHNSEISKILNAGHKIFSAYVQMVNRRAHPEEQVRVVVFVEKVLE